MKQRIHIVEILSIAFIFSAVLVLSLRPIAQTDTFYHITSGNYILETKTVPTQDIFSTSAKGRDWVPHEWLAQIIFSLVYAAGGLWWLIAFSAFVAVIAYLFVFKLALERGAHPAVAAIIIAFTHYLTRGHWVPRPQIFGYLFFAILFFLLERYRGRKDRSYLLYALALLWLWANMHASFPLGLIVFTLYLAPNIIAPLKKKDIRAALIPAGWILASICISLLSPGTYKSLLYFSMVRETAMAMTVLEWMPIVAFWYAPQTKIAIFALVCFVAFSAFIYGRQKTSRNIVLLCLVLGVSFMPFISVRHVGFAALVFAVAVPAGISLVAGIKEYLDGRRKEIFIGLLLFSLIWLYGGIGKATKTYVDTRFVPVALTDFVVRQNIRGPFFNLYNEGGYFIWRLWPRDKVFIDSRSEVYAGRPLEEFLTVLHRKPGWKNLLDDKYRINAILLPYQPMPIGEVTGPFNLELVQRNFTLVYWDDSGLVLLRTVKENEDVIKRFGFFHINPFRDPTSIPKEEARAAAMELFRLQSQHPNAYYINRYADQFLSSHPVSTSSSQSDLSP